MRHWGKCRKIMRIRWLTRKKLKVTERALQGNIQMPSLQPLTHTMQADEPQMRHVRDDIHTMIQWALWQCMGQITKVYSDTYLEKNTPEFIVISDNVKCAPNRWLSFKCCRCGGIFRITSRQFESFVERNTLQCSK